MNGITALFKNKYEHWLKLDVEFETCYRKSELRYGIAYRSLCLIEEQAHTLSDSSRQKGLLKKDSNLVAIFTLSAL